MSYGQLFSCYASAIVGVLWLVPLAPFCKLIAQPLITAPVPTLDMLILELSLWDMNIVAKCSTRVPGLRDLSLWFCEKMKPMWGRHRFSHVHQYACNLEEQSKHAILFGCDKLTIITYGSKIVAFIWACAALCQLCAAINSYLFAALRPKQFDVAYLERFDADRMQRRAIMVTLYVCAPILGIIGFLVSIFVFDVSDMIMPTLIKPPEGQIYPIAWGSGWVVITSILSISSCIMCFCTVNDDEPTDSEMGSDGDNECLLQDHEDPYGHKWQLMDDPYGQSQTAGAYANAPQAVAASPTASAYGMNPYASTPAAVPSSPYASGYGFR